MLVAAEPSQVIKDFVGDGSSTRTQINSVFKGMVRVRLNSNEAKSGTAVSGPRAYTTEKAGHQTPIFCAERPRIGAEALAFVERDRQEHGRIGKRDRSRAA